MRRAIFRPRPRRRWGRRLLLAGLAVLLATVLQVLALRWIDPPTSAFMLAHRGAVQYDWRDLDAISPQLPIAVVAAEDQKFPSHRGFDVDAIRDAIDERGERVRGASTISQQVAKNLFLWAGQDWLRKGLEAWYTVLIEALWPKSRIVEVYVNIAEFGDGIYGAEAAARRFFGVAAADLSAAQCALLAAVLPNPKRLLVASPSTYVRGRQAWIQRQVRQLGGPGYLDAAD